MATFNSVFVIVTLSLVLQLAVLTLVLYGYVLYRKLKLRQHGIIMALAVLIHLGAVFGIMLPSFVFAVLPEYILVHPLGLTSLVSLVHEVTGAVALGLGIWFVAAWRFRKSFAGCFNRRWAMLATLIIWVAALLFGVTLYTIFNWTILMG